MSTLDCSDEIGKYHDDKVTLRENDRRDMRERRDNGRTRLERGLTEAEHPQPKMVCSQGSYQMRTMVQDDDCDYDIDDGVYFRPEDLRDAEGRDLSPRQARQRVCDALTRDQRFASPAEVHDNCVRQEYQAGYHIDMPVYRVRLEKDEGGSEREVYELASGDTWQVSDARAVTKWFKDAVHDLNGDDGQDGLQMRRVVRLTKMFARSRGEWKAETTSGITLSKLVVDEFRPSADRDDVALRDTWSAIAARLQGSSAVDHPVNPAPLAKAGNEKVAFFHDKLAEALVTLEVLDEDDCTRNEARAAWDTVFNKTHFSKLPDPREPEGGKRAFFVATESKSDRRDDGNGRYGAGASR
ncbi:hypothetical protein JI752_001410 [Lysobacter sp. MMG2]|uniref:cyclic GMP-AMP synthase DncV-like nucleotidyltransferase n=1 Tax=Lysobacter sp. MMG2 TaxID=2801338 RepID=UPI001C24630D|nr:hypothetical protein [Lysobacter sp. MMG2]MBU8974789.1 hypothetical protein [Lysobacter sp. MMG2]